MYNIDIWNVRVSEARVERMKQKTTGVSVGALIGPELRNDNVELH